MLIYLSRRLEPDGGCIVEIDGEVEHYTKEEIDEMERDYLQTLERLSQKYAQ